MNKTAQATPKRFRSSQGQLQTSSNQISYHWKVGVDKAVRVVIADDLNMFREGIRVLLDMKPEIDVVGEAENGVEAYEVINKEKPDVVLLDINMPLMNGFEVAKKLKARRLDTKIIMLSVHDEKVIIKKAFLYGASGYVLKHSIFKEVLNAIENVQSGGKYLSSELAHEINPDELEHSDGDVEITPLDVLTDRELEILFLIATGNTNTQIAKNLRISDKTVEKHRSNLIRKLGIRSVAELTQMAIKYNLVILEE